MFDASALLSAVNDLEGTLDLPNQEFRRLLGSAALTYNTSIENRYLQHMARIGGCGSDGKYRV